MGVEKETKSAWGPGLILAVLFIDVGLLIWGWHLYQRRQERLDDAGLNFARAPEPTAPAALPPPGAVAEEPLPGIDRYVKKEALPQAPPPAAAGTPAAAPGGKPAAPKLSVPAPSSLSAEMRAKMDKAVDTFFDLKNSPRFKNSKVIQGWKRDFMGYPDLKALNDEWRKEHDPLKFMMGMVRSPNFQTMAKQYLLQQDMRDFIKEMAGSKTVKDSAAGFMTDESVKTAAAAFGMLGGAPPMKDSAQALQQTKANPTLKPFLQDGAAPPVR